MNIRKNKKIATIFYFLFTFNICVFAQNGQDLVEQANKLHKAGDKKKAEQLYLKAAAQGNADAHFALAYTYVRSQEEYIFHYGEAAKRGHSKALFYVFEKMLFRGNSLTRVDPQKAYHIYQAAKKSNPALGQQEGEGSNIDVIKKCMEVGPFDGQAFMDKYGLTKEKLDGNYEIWQLAEEASRGGRFGDPNPELTFQLIIRGGHVPAEFTLAALAAYKNWKNNQVWHFDICDFITSGQGGALCSFRKRQVFENEFDEKFSKLKSRLDIDTQKLLNAAFKVAAEFFQMKTWKEEGHGGTGRITWENESMEEKKADYLAFFDSIIDGVAVDTITSNTDWDKELNTTYKEIMRQLKANPVMGHNYSITAEGVRKVQRLWIPYRDKSAKLYAVIVPSIKEEAWRNWLTKIRTKQIMLIKDFM